MRQSILVIFTAVLATGQVLAEPAPPQVQVAPQGAVQRYEAQLLKVRESDRRAKEASAIFQSAKREVSKPVMAEIARKNKGKILDPYDAKEMAAMDKRLRTAETALRARKAPGQREIDQYTEALLPYARYAAVYEHLQSNDSLVVPPGGAVTARVQGHTTTTGTWGLSKGQGLRISSATERVDPKMMPLYEGLLRRVPANEAERSRIQNLLWMVQRYSQLDEDIRRYKLRKLDMEDYKIIVQILPEDGLLRLRDHLNREDEIILARNIMNYRPMSPAQTGPDNYSLPAPGVAVRANIEAGRPGDKSNNVDIQIVNGGQDAYVFRPTEQMALPGCSEIPSMGLGNILSHTLLTAKDTEAYKAAKAAIERTGEAAAFALERAMQADPALAALGLDERGRAFVKLGVDNVPVVGSFLSLVECRSGRNWMTGEPLDGNADRFMSCMSAIPGARAVTAVAESLGMNGPRFVQNLEKWNGAHPRLNDQRLKSLIENGVHDTVQNEAGGAMDFTLEALGGLTERAQG